MNDRQKFIQFLFDKLNNNQYVLLKHIEHSVLEIDENSDLDFLISKEDFKSIYRSITEFKQIKKCDIKSQSTMCQLFIFFEDDSYLQLDFLFGFYRKGIEYLSKEAVFKFAKTNEEGIKICSNHHLVEHLMLFNFLNFSGIPSKYLNFLNKEAPEEIRNIIYYLKLKYKQPFQSINDLEKYQPKIRKSINKLLFEKSENYGFNLLTNRLNYFFDTVKNIFKSRGFIITFSGVDGSGKSTIIQNVKEKLEGKYRRNVVILRHRPSVLPILSSYKHGREKAEQIATQSLPRTGKNESKLGSILRFSYYYLDYLLGQLYVNTRYIWRGYVVIYDRYYFDFIVDSKRSNIEIPQSIPTFLYRFVNHPKLNLFLYAKPEMILERKKELDATSISELTKNYKSLFNSLKSKSQSSHYIPIENINKEETLDFVFKQYETLV